MPSSQLRSAASAAVGLAAAFLLTFNASAATAADGALPKDVPAGTTLVVGDQYQELQTLLSSSGEQSKLAANVTYANFVGGNSVLEAFRAGALDIASVGVVPPIQAQAIGETLPIIVARRTSDPDHQFAFRPGLKLAKLSEFRGKRIAYVEGTARQAFVLAALKEAGLTKNDVKLVNLRTADLPDAVRTGQVDIAPLNEPYFSRYIETYKDDGASSLPESEYGNLPRNMTFLYARPDALKDPAKAAAIRDYVAHYLVAQEWRHNHPDEWVKTYYVKALNLDEPTGRAIINGEGEVYFPSLSSIVPIQQATADLMHDAGDLPQHLDARDEFDLRFDEVINAFNASAGKKAN